MLIRSWQGNVSWLLKHVVLLDTIPAKTQLHSTMPKLRNEIRSVKIQYPSNFLAIKAGHKRFPYANVHGKV